MISNAHSQPSDASATPEVSVIIPAYNTEAYIAQAIASALDQTLSNIEVIVVDDASTDGTAAIAQRIPDPRLCVYRHPQNLGAAAARNQALKKARGTWVAVLDSDDWYAPERLEILVQLADEHNADMIADDLWYIEEQGTTPWGTLISQSGEPIDTIKLIDAVYFVETDVHGRQGLHLGLSKPLMRRDFLLSHHISYDEAVRMGQDFFLYLECLIRGARFFLYPQPYYFYRTRPDSLVTKSQVARLSQACQATENLLTQEIVQANLQLTNALTRNLSVYRRNRSYYRVVEPFKKKRFFTALLEMIRNPYFFIRFAQQLPKSLLIRINYYLLDNRSVTRRGVYNLREVHTIQEQLDTKKVNG
jgi:succinoglycan biosynthesis protein ExoO